MSVAELSPFVTTEPWPSALVRGELDRARVEWLHTNGAGAYSSSTVALMHTRRYHGLLVAALDPPRGRHVILSHMDMVLEVGGARYELASHQFPSVPPTGGHRWLERFDQDPLPRWTWAVGDARFEQSCALVRGENALVLRYTWQGDKPMRLLLRPLLAMRPFHSLMREHGSMIHSVELRQGEVRVRPVPALPQVLFGHEAIFIGSPDWWRRFEYLMEQNRGLDFEEDLWTPGIFSQTLAPGETTHLVVALEALPERPASELLRESAAAIRSNDPGPRHKPTTRKLAIAADAFRADLAERPGIVAGYPWFEVWGRDSLISLPGLYLVSGKLDEARAVLRSTIASMDHGLVPNRWPDEGKPAESHSADATLWLFEAARLYAEQVGLSDEFVQGELIDGLREAFEAMHQGTLHGIHITGEGLFAAGDEGYALTWMDARVGDWVVTPRAGLPVELQALYARGCDTLATLAAIGGDDELAARAKEAHIRALFAFRRRFWCEETAFPYDVVSTEASGERAWADASIRPNAVIALAVEPRLFDAAQAASLLEVAERELLTPAGLRTLSPRSEGYVPRYMGGVRERDAAYHQGTVWPFLLGYYVRAARAHRPNDTQLAEHLERLVESAAANALALGQVPEIADGDPPHRPRGCFAQAWSVAELLRALVWDLS